MANQTILATAGFAMVLSFMYLIISKRMSAMNALILVPVIFALCIGYYDARLGEMMISGVIKVAPTGIMICFAILFFGTMIDAGLFDPVINKILKIVHGDPMKVCVGTALLASVISLDGDGSTTYLVTCSAMLGVHRRLGIRPIILPALAVLENSVMNIVLWGGPTSRVLAALNVESSSVFVPMIPCMMVGTLFVCFLGYYWGMQERKRLDVLHIVYDEHQLGCLDEPEVEKLKRPKNVWLNFALTVTVMVSLMTEILPLPIVFIMGTALALLINYKNQEQQERICANGANAMPVVSMVFSAGIFMGILSGTKMIDAMSVVIIEAVPKMLVPHFSLVTALVSLPATFFMTNDAFYFGVLPVLAKAASIYGISPEEMGRAALIGQGAHLLSPLVPSTYLLVGLSKVDFGELQKFALLPAIGISMIWLFISALLGNINL